MGHSHSHGPHAHRGHSHQQQHPATNALRTAFLVNLLFVGVELAGGWWTGSMAVLTDAVHDLGDSLVLATAWYLQQVARKGENARYTYGYARYSMLGGWLASIVLIIGAVVMIIAAAPHLLAPTVPHAPGMIALALVGMAMNGYAAWRLHGGSSLNERGAYLHLLEDVLGWAAVLVGGTVIHFTGWGIVDPLLSIGIALFILWNAVDTLRQGTAILMQAHPTGVDHERVRDRLLAIEGVQGLSDLHTWTLDGSFVVGSVHLVVLTHDLKQARQIKDKARNLLKELGVGHATIELEWPGEPEQAHP